ncbi:phosphatase 2C-like domain-containing protein [Leptodontidium sp. 2 PMI_412]|nr:phosphatase 2C-like domain-containing protein [Leptodontidium sp. MPI-SDFR-AT-0119]KAH9221565.1 phosphatase 2C-like domain-containing protein [Leptodontidium sp. 2 PMI_412]
MRRSAFRVPAARAILPQTRRSLTKSTPRCRPELATSSTATSADQPVVRSDPLPFRFETGLALFAKRAPRPFPPPFLSPPSGSFSDPLSTHDRSRDRRPLVNGQKIRGYTNGDDAVYASDQFIAADDGVGAWSTRPGGHAGLWARLILHFWAVEAEADANRLRPPGEFYTPTPIEYLQKAYEQTIEATSQPNQWQGTTTASGAQLHFQRSNSDPDAPPTPLLYVTNLGDSQVLVIRPRDGRDGEKIYKTTEQWHWFDCPRQLGTNSPDTPRDNAVMDKVEIEENDVVLAMSDGVIDNLWEHEIIQNVVDSIQKWENGHGGASTGDRKGGAGGGMKFVAEELMKAAKVIATDPFAESPFMEHAVEEGLAMEGGKLDDISVVAALCRRSKG